MRLHHAASIALLLVPVLSTAQENLGTYEDRIAVEDVMARYVWAVDSLDPDGYVAVFTDDATIDSNGSISKGHAEIRRSSPASCSGATTTRQRDCRRRICTM